MTTFGDAQKLKDDERRGRRAEGRGRVVAFSVSFEEENLLERGLGLEHLQDLLTRIGRPLLRSGMNLAYGGHWEEVEGNFTHHLLELINAELDDRGEQSSTAGTPLDMLYNHSAWPNYLAVTPATEAQWVRCCRIVRVTQEMAGIPKGEIIPDKRSSQKTAQKMLNAARTSSAMRCLTMEEIEMDHPAGVKPEVIPPVEARLALGGKLGSYSGFMPGIFEEAVLTLRKNKPLYILGGFGGAAEALAKAIFQPTDKWDKLLTKDGQKEANPRLEPLLTSAGEDVRRMVDKLYTDLKQFVVDARADPEKILKTGLGDENRIRKLFLTSSTRDSVDLTLKGMQQVLHLPHLGS